MLHKLFFHGGVQWTQETGLKILTSKLCLILPVKVAKFMQDSMILIELFQEKQMKLLKNFSKPILKAQLQLLGTLWEEHFLKFVL